MHEPMLHMDENYQWRWFIIDEQGVEVAMSTRSFATCGEARRDFDAARKILALAA